MYKKIFENTSVANGQASDYVYVHLDDNQTSFKASLSFKITCSDSEFTEAVFQIQQCNDVSPTAQWTTIKGGFITLAFPTSTMTREVTRSFVGKYIRIRVLRASSSSGSPILINTYLAT